MFVSPDKWRKMFKPGLDKLIRTVKSTRPDLLLVYKSDGYIEPIVPDLIHIGVDSLCPVQAGAMDAVKIKKNFGKHLGMWGTVSTQSLLPFGTPQEVKDKVQENMRVLGEGGGLVITPDQIRSFQISHGKTLLHSLKRCINSGGKETFSNLNLISKYNRWTRAR